MYLNLTLIYYGVKVMNPQFSKLWQQCIFFFKKKKSSLVHLSSAASHICLRTFAVYMNLFKMDFCHFILYVKRKPMSHI